MQPDAKKRIGILRGGMGENYESSLREGGDFISYVVENLSDKWQPVDILIDRDGVWHAGGKPIQPAELMPRVDLVWNLSHPSFSNILESFSIPNLGAPIFSSAVPSSRKMLENHMKHIGIKMPRTIAFPLYQADFDGPENKYAEKKAKEVFEKFSSPWVVQSLTRDSNIGIRVAKTFPELVGAIGEIMLAQKSILVEELISGKTASLHSIAGFRGEEVYTFPPGNFSGAEKEKLINLAKEMYSHLSAKHYLKSDFVLHPKGKIYLTHVDFSPDLSPDSHFCKCCESVGSKPKYIIEHILDRAI